MNDNRTDNRGAKAVIVLQPVTDTINTALRIAGYQPDAITPDCVVYLRTRHGEPGQPGTDRHLENSGRGPVGGGAQPQKLLLTRWHTTPMIRALLEGLAQ
jgi:hypothetical protein